jgi:predicted RecB family nuclease
VRNFNGKLIHSATDLINFVECPHLTAIDLGVVQGRLHIEATRTDSSDLVATKGEAHEAAYLQALLADGKEVVTIAPDSALDLDSASERTIAAMRDGAEIIFQSALYDGTWAGYADFLERVDKRSDLGSWSYEVADTKLARKVKPYFLPQLCLYTDLLTQIQGTIPENMHVVLGTGERASFVPAEFLAYYRRVQERYLAEIAEMSPTYPHFAEHCGLCRWSEHCDQQRVDDDYLGLVAWMRRDQIVRLERQDITTMAGLALADDAHKPGRMMPATYDNLRLQAELQVDQRETGEHSYVLLEPEAGRGLARLPEPSPGDLFFDMEGDPFVDQGLEYLFGVTWIEEGEPRFKPFWGTDRSAEKRAFEDFMDFVAERRRIHPSLHVYHYAPYEPTALKGLMGMHATREDALDELLRNDVLVDLFAVVRQGMRISQPSYSIKKVEAFYMPEREASVTDGEDSIIQFERWLDEGDDSILESIERYNEEDCLSTWKLREWLLERREEAMRVYGVDIPWRIREEVPPPDPDEAAELTALREALLSDLREEAPEDRRRLMAQLLDYHRREAKPGYWAYYARLEMDDEELWHDSEALAEIEETDVPPLPLPPPARSLIYTLKFSAQEHKVSRGDYVDPATEADVAVVRLDDATGTLEIRRSDAKQDDPLPQALIPGKPYWTGEQRKALQRIGADVAARGVDAAGQYSAARDVLKRRGARTSAVAAGAPLQNGAFDLEHAKEIVAGLQDSYLFIQGPPGSGKTYTGAHLILHLLAQGKRIGVTSNSHKAIIKLLHEVEKFAAEKGQAFVGLKKYSDSDDMFESELDEPLIGNTTSNVACADSEVDLVAGTAWLFSREDMESKVDYVFFDEAGQVSLADALAMSTAARNLVFLGDPNQLAQVSQATHPPGAGCSVLEHLLDEDVTIPPERGMFIEHTRRMHPDVAGFISEVVYEGRLESLEECANQSFEAPRGQTGTGMRWIPVEHEANTRRSPEEAKVVAQLVADLLDGGTYTKSDKSTVPLTADQIMVVTPYNAQVRELREALPDEVEVGTVDKFQGQEAAVVLFSMATSSGEEIPRNLEFLFSRNRLNVAVSRARCLAAVVVSPKLLHVRCRTADQMRLVNALCRLAEVSEAQLLQAEAIKGA